MMGHINPIPNIKHAGFLSTTVSWAGNSFVYWSPYLVYRNKIIWHQIRALRF